MTEPERPFCAKCKRCLELNQIESAYQDVKQKFASRKISKQEFDIARSNRMDELTKRSFTCMSCIHNEVKKSLFRKYPPNFQSIDNFIPLDEK